MQVSVTGKRENKRGERFGDALRRIYKGPVFICEKIERIIYDLCLRISHKYDAFYWYLRYFLHLNSKQLSHQNRAAYRHHTTFIRIKTPAHISERRLYAKLWGTLKIFRQDNGFWGLYQIYLYDHAIPISGK